MQVVKDEDLEDRTSRTTRPHSETRVARREGSDEGRGGGARRREATSRDAATREDPSAKDGAGETTDARGEAWAPNGARARRVGGADGHGNGGDERMCARSRAWTDRRTRCTMHSQMADFELPSNSADLQGEIREWLKKKRTAEAKVNQVLALLDPARLEVGTKAYQKPEWRKDGPPSMYRAHWRHQACSILGVEEKDIPEHVVTALKAYVWPNALDTKKADEEAWLIKVPKFLSRVWHDDVNPEEAVGSVRVFVDPFEKDSSKSMTHGVIELKGKDAEDVPKHYILANQPTDMPMHVFSDDRDENVSDMALMGKVAVKLDMRPRSIDDADYHRVSKDRMIKAQTKTRVTQSSSEMRFAPLPKARNLVRFTDAAANKPEKKERMEKKELENMLFGLFERQSYWSLKQLILETKQPVDWLKTNLNEIALLTRRGPNMGLWGLKPEWRQAGVPQQQ